MSAEQFKAMFRRATNGNDPLPYQERLALADSLPSLLDVPTGLGKTAATILAWIWRRRFCKTHRDSTPRRLVYCLPMRVLVEQTHRVAIDWLNRLRMLAEEAKEQYPNWSRPDGDLGDYPAAVYLLLGGEEQTDWALWPERDAILIGTQDMLLSRALNRGYGMSRYRWPVHFGLLNNDCLWVMDETQLMGSGLLTTAQLAAFGEKLWSRAKPSRFLWMSATLGDTFLDTRDRRDWHVLPGTKLELSADDLQSPAILTRLRAPKAIAVVKDRPKPSLILDEHAIHGVGRLSLLVFNTVPAAKKMFGELQAEASKPARRRKGPVPAFCLIHGRFRSGDRKRQLQQVEAFASQVDRETGAVPGSPGLVIVSTQVVEAGFDISSVRLWSEIAPWSSVVQRLGRLNREGRQPNALATFWRPKEERDGENKPDSPNAKRIGPYDKAAIDIGQRLLTEVQEAMGAGEEYRDALDQVSQSDISRDALQVAAECVIRPDDLLELFGTDHDLAGGFTNVSQFVRDSDRNVDAQVFWRDFSPKHAWRLDEQPPNRDELCAVPFFELRRFLGTKGGAWEWNAEINRWERRSAKDIWPGMTLMLPLSAGGYSDELGWTGVSNDKPTTLQAVDAKENVGLADEPDSQTDLWYPLPNHLADVNLDVATLVAALRPSDAVAQALQIAAHWHDWGKALPRWQRAVHSFAGRVRDRIQELLSNSETAIFHQLLGDWLPKWNPPSDADGTSVVWAKFPDVREIWMNRSLAKEDAKQLRRLLRVKFTPRVRHEAASALAAWDAWLSGDKQLSALAVFLIASHHGKVRTVLRSTWESDEVFGLKANDTLPPIPGYFSNTATMHFEPKHLGAHGVWDDDGMAFEMVSPSWTEVVADLLGTAMPNAKSSSDVIPDGEPQSLGPFALAFYEAILVAADIRASKRPGKAKQVQP
ncbi:MAG: DEAD/DEAH box helicase [Pirellulaceae bacterium]|nr:DEAD/DEAH box helicase [Pirellulaceae bacterium]